MQGCRNLHQSVSVHKMLLYVFTLPMVSHHPCPFLSNPLSPLSLHPSSPLPSPPPSFPSLPLHPFHPSPYTPSIPPPPPLPSLPLHPFHPSPYTPLLPPLRDTVHPKAMVSVQWECSNSQLHPTRLALHR